MTIFATSISSGDGQVLVRASLPLKQYKLSLIRAELYYRDIHTEMSDKQWRVPPPERYRWWYTSKSIN